MLFPLCKGLIQVSDFTETQNQCFQWNDSVNALQRSSFLLLCRCLFLLPGQYLLSAALWDPWGRAPEVHVVRTRFYLCRKKSLGCSFHHLTVFSGRLDVDWIVDCFVHSHRCVLNKRTRSGVWTLMKCFGKANPIVAEICLFLALDLYTSAFLEVLISIATLLWTSTGQHCCLVGSILHWTGHYFYTSPSVAEKLNQHFSRVGHTLYLILEVKLTIWNRFFCCCLCVA